MEVAVDQRPYLASFEDPPKGSKWENVSTTPTSEHRQFVAPTTFDPLLTKPYLPMATSTT